MAQAKAKAQTTTEKVEAQPVKLKRLNAIDLQLKEAVQAQYTALVPPGTTREEVIDPGYWVHVAQQLRAMTEITIIPKDGAWYGRYFVRYADRNSARVVELEYHELQVLTADEVASSEYEIDFTTAEMFRVLRIADQVVLEKGFGSKDEAMVWMAEHMKAMAA